MSSNSIDQRAEGQHPPHGAIGYVQIPALDIATSTSFYAAVFGWRVDNDYASFEAPGMIGQWVTDRPPVTGGGPVVWICVDQIGPTLERVSAHGGIVRTPPTIDGGERWLAEITDPAGNPVGVVGAVLPISAQPLLAVRDVEAASRWYQQILGLRSDHGGPDYERLVSCGTLVLQLHRWDVEHDHGAIGDPNVTPGNGALVWFGEVHDFDGAVERAARLNATIVMPEHRNPPDGNGGPNHREIWIKDLDGYTVVIASPDGELD